MRSFGVRLAVLLAVIVLGGLMSAGRADAAELKLKFSELARIVSAAMGDPKLRLHNVPPGPFDLTPGSSLTAGTTTMPFTFAARTFEAGGATYAYYVNDLNSKTIKVSAVPSGLRVAIAFAPTGPAMIGRCISGLCLISQSLPVISWKAATISFDLAPVLTAGGRLSLIAKKVDVGGTFIADCSRAKGVLGGPLCSLALAEARKTTATLKTDLNGSLIKDLNSPDMQAKLIDTLRGSLQFGGAGEVRFSKVLVEPDALTLAFCLACQSG